MIDAAVSQAASGANEGRGAFLIKVAQVSPENRDALHSSLLILKSLLSNVMPVTVLEMIGGPGGPCFALLNQVDDADGLGSLLGNIDDATEMLESNGLNRYLRRGPPDRVRDCMARVNGLADVVDDWAAEVRMQRGCGEFGDLTIGSAFVAEPSPGDWSQALQALEGAAARMSGRLAAAHVSVVSSLGSGVPRLALVVAGRSSAEIAGSEDLLLSVSGVEPRELDADRVEMGQPPPFAQVPQALHALGRLESSSWRVDRSTYRSRTASIQHRTKQLWVRSKEKVISQFSG